MVRVATGADVPNTNFGRDPGLNVPRTPAQFLGAGLVDVGFGIDDVADAQLRREERERRAVNAQALAEFESGLSGDATDLLNETKRTAPDRPVGIAGETMTSFEEMAEARVNSLPEHLQASARLTTTDFGARYEEGLKNFEHARVVNDTARSTTADLDDFAIQAFRNPEDMPQLIDEADLRGKILRELGAEPDHVERLVTAAKQNIAVSGLHGVDPVGRLDALRSRKFDDDIGDADLIRRLEKEAEREIREAQQGANSEVRGQIDDHIASLQTTGIGIPGFREKAAAVMKPEDFQAFARQERTAIRYHDASKAFFSTSPSEMVGMLAEFEPVPGATDFAEQQDLFVTLQKHASGVLQLREKDPAKAAMQIPSIQTRMTESQELLAENPNDLAVQQDFQAALGARLEIQGDLGVSPVGRKPLASSEAKAVIEQIRGAATDDRASVILGLQQTYGPHWLPVMGQLAEEGLDGRHKVLATVAAEPGVSATLSQIIDTDSTELVKGLEQTEVRDTRAAVRDELADFMAAIELGDPTGGRAEQVNEVISAVEDLAVLRLRQGLGSSEAAQSAAEQVILNRFQIQDGYYMPLSLEGQPIDPSRVSTQAIRMQREDNIRAFDPVEYGSIFGPGQDVLEAGTLATAVNSGFWVTNESGTGAFLMVPFRDGSALPLLNEAGQRYEFGFLEATRSPIRAAPLPADTGEPFLSEPIGP